MKYNKDIIHQYIKAHHSECFVRKDLVETNMFGKQRLLYPEWYAAIERPDKSFAIFYYSSIDGNDKRYVPDAYGDKYKNLLEDYIKVPNRLCIMGETLWDDWPSDDLEHIFNIKNVVSFGISELEVKNLTPEQIKKLKEAVQEFKNSKLSDLITELNYENTVKPETELDWFVSELQSIKPLTAEEERYFRMGAHWAANTLYEKIERRQDRVSDASNEIKNIFEKAGIEVIDV